MDQSAFRTLRRGFVTTAAAAAVILRAGWHLFVLLLRRVAEVALALVILFEEWGWRPLSDLLAQLARWQPLARAEAVIAALPPYLALVAFVLPTALFFPLKLLALYLIAKGQAVLATGVFVFAKVFGTALLARLFQLTQPALMRIGWFAAAYHRFVPWKDATFAAIRQSWVWRRGRTFKARVKKAVAALWTEVKPRLTATLGDIQRRLRLWLDRGR